MQTEQEKIQPTTLPDAIRGNDVIYNFIISVNKLFALSQEEIKKRFYATFQKDAEHLWDKFSQEKFAGFFLNLDLNNSRRFLHYFYSGDEIVIELPAIIGFKELGKKIFGDQEFTEDDVRSTAPGFNMLNKWDAYPHDLIFIEQFLLYANNNSIDAKEYEGNRFGNYENWAKYFLWMWMIDRIQFVKQLIQY